MREHTGRCPCGRIEVVLATDVAADRLQPRSDAATCAFCREHDGVWVSDPAGSLVVRADDGTDARRFASRQVAFHFCPDCAALVYALFRDPLSPAVVGVVRLGLFPALRAVAPPPVVTSFDGEPADHGLRRRLQRWTPVRRR
jgi:hypothetical protein